MKANDRRIKEVSDTNSDGGAPDKSLTPSQARNKQRAIDEERASWLKHTEENRYALLVYSMAWFICIVTACLFVATIFLTAFGKLSVAHTLLPYLTYPLSGIIGAVIGRAIQSRT